MHSGAEIACSRDTTVTPARGALPAHRGPGSFVGDSAMGTILYYIRGLGEYHLPRTFYLPLDSTLYIHAMMPDTPTSAAAAAAAWLFVPGDRPERFDKAAASGADVVIVDLEDAVPAAHKDAAREHAAGWLSSTSAVAAVRVNAAGTPWHSDDVARLAMVGPSLVVLPKAEEPSLVCDLIAALPPGSAVVALLETARGILHAPEIALIDGVHRLILGSFDLAAELGVDPDHWPALAGSRQALVLASAAAQIPGPVDGVTGDVGDQGRLVEDVSSAAALGFTGKLCIHPAQVPIAISALSPSTSDIAWAERVLTAAHTADGGVVVVDGRMVDPPVVARARRILSTRRGPVT